MKQKSVIRQKVFMGDILYSQDKDTLAAVENGYIAVRNGSICGIYEELPEDLLQWELIDWRGRLIIPGFSDLHVHAPQFLQRGIGMDKELLDWLDSYTFPTESRFADPEHARRVYSLFVDELLRQGTLHVNCFPSIHYEASHILFEILAERGLFAYTGKLNMDQNSPDYYIEDTNESLRETDRFLQEHPQKGNVTASVVPRFTVTCSEPLLSGLGEIASRYDALVHSHMCEAVNEMKVVQELFPQYKNGAEIFHHNRLLGQTKTVMAHCIFMDEEVVELMKNENCLAVHCPDATANINSGGIMPVKKLLDKGVKLAIGSDMGSGAKMGIYHQVAQTIQHSKIRNMFDPQWDAVTLPEAFYMATKSGGSFFGKTGTFEDGYLFNALVIDDRGMAAEGLNLTERLERFCYIGDDRNIVMRYIRGEGIEA